jgi:hypothetical protein
MRVLGSIGESMMMAVMGGPPQRAALGGAGTLIQ